MDDSLWISYVEQIIREVKGPEKDELILRLENEWEVRSHYWFPLVVSGDKKPPHTEAFQATYFEEELTHDTLRQIFESHNITTLFEWREGAMMCEIELAQFHPYYTGLEGFWFTSQLDWLIYASHESSITVGGEWLLLAVQAAWPNWERRVWTSPFYD